MRVFGILNTKILLFYFYNNCCIIDYSNVFRIKKVFSQARAVDKWKLQIHRPIGKCGSVSCISSNTVGARMKGFVCKHYMKHASRTFKMKNTNLIFTDWLSLYSNILVSVTHFLHRFIYWKYVLDYCIFQSVF